MAQYEVRIVVNLDTGQVVRGQRELDRVLGQIGQGDLARTRTLDREKLRAIQRGNQELTREHQRTARNAQRQYEEHLGSGFFSRLARGASTAFNRNFSVSGTGSGGGFGGFLGAAAGVAGGNIAASAILSVVGGITSAMSSGVKIGMDYNRMQEEVALGFTVILKSGKAAKDLMGQLVAFAEQSPMDLPGVYTGAQRLLAMGFNAKQIIPILRAAGDAAAGMGKTGAEAAQHVDRVVLALGQMWQKGKVSAQEMSRQLVEAGIPAWKYLADEIARTDQRFSKLTDEQRLTKVQQMAEKGMLNARTAVAVVLRGIETDFGGLGERISRETASGIETNLGDVLARQLGTASGPAFEGYKKVIERLRQAAGGDAADTLVGGISMSSQKLFDAMHSLSLDSVTGFLKGFDDSNKRVMTAAANMGQSAIDSVADIIGARSPATEFIKLGEFAAQGFILGLQEGLKNEKLTLDKETLESAIKNPIVQTFMEALRQIEGGEPNRVVGGATFNPRALKPGQHPGDLGMGMQGPAGWSTAAGNWQITRTNWNEWKEKLGLTDFGDVAQQMKVALALLNEAGGLAPLLRGDFVGAAHHTQPWAASPFSTLLGGKRQDFLPNIFNMMNGGTSFGQGSPIPVVIVGPAPERQSIPSNFASTGQNLFDQFRGSTDYELMGRADRLATGHPKLEDYESEKQFLTARVGLQQLEKLNAKQIGDLEQEYLGYLREELRYREALADYEVARSRAAEPLSESFDLQRIKPAFDALQQAHSEIIDTSRSAYQLSTNYVPLALRSLQLPALETADAFANLPPLIKQVAGTAEEFEKQMDTAGRSIASLFGDAVSTLLTDPKNAMQTLRDNFKQFLADLLRDYVESELFNLLRPDAEKPGTSILGSIISHIFGGGKSSNNNSTGATGAANTIAQLLPSVGGSVHLPAMLGGSFGFGMPAMDIPLNPSSFFNLLGGGSNIPTTPPRVSTPGFNGGPLTLDRIFGDSGSTGSAGRFSGLSSGLASIAPLLGVGLGASVGGQSIGGQIAGGAGGLILGTLAASALGSSSAASALGSVASFLGFGPSSALLATGVFAAAGAALLVGAYIMKRNKERRQNEEKRTELSGQAYADTITILNKARSGGYSSVSEALADFEKVKSGYFSSIAGFDSKTKRIAGDWFTRDFEPYYKPLIVAAAQQAEEAHKRSAQMNPEFRDGGAVFAHMNSSQMNWASSFRRFADGGNTFSGLVPGVYDRKDNNLIRVSGDEVVLTPDDWQPIAPYLRARRVKGFADGGAVAEDARPVYSSSTEKEPVVFYVMNNFDGEQLVTSIMSSDVGQKIIVRTMTSQEGRRGILHTMWKARRDRAF